MSKNSLIRYGNYSAGGACGNFWRCDRLAYSRALVSPLNRVTDSDGGSEEFLGSRTRRKWSGAQAAGARKYHSSLAAPISDLYVTPAGRLRFGPQWAQLAELRRADRARGAVGVHYHSETRDGRRAHAPNSSRLMIIIRGLLWPGSTLESDTHKHTQAIEDERPAPVSSSRRLGGERAPATSGARPPAYPARQAGQRGSRPRERERERRETRTPRWSLSKLFQFRNSICGPSLNAGLAGRPLVWAFSFRSAGRPGSERQTTTIDRRRPRLLPTIRPNLKRGRWSIFVVWTMSEHYDSISCFLFDGQLQSATGRLAERAS
jgi:hypothetical protein